MNVLAVDDSFEGRLILKNILKKEGHEVFLASNGEEAWDIIKYHNINLLITDWIMPKMDGLQLTRKIRNAGLSHYIYIFLITGRGERKDMITALEAGADDFIIKPINTQELKVRIRASERILELEEDLELKNKKLLEYNKQLENDLKAASSLQNSLLPKNQTLFRKYRFESLFIPSSFLAGDIYNFFKIGENIICFYLLDVSGHGVAASMLSFTLSKILSNTAADEHNVLKKYDPLTNKYILRTPEDVLSELNSSFQMSADSLQYFTIVFGYINTDTNEVNLSSAGHPFPLLLKSDSSVKKLELKSFPIGFLPKSEYENFSFKLNENEKFFIYSDGITEIEQLNEPDFINYFSNYLISNGNLELNELLNKLSRDLFVWNDSEHFIDDISILGIERTSF